MQAYCYECVTYGECRLFEIVTWKELEKRPYCQVCSFHIFTTQRALQAWSFAYHLVPDDPRVDMEYFASWLCEHEQDIVGCPGSCFDSPLARWLSEQDQHVYGVDDNRYGRASLECNQWRRLPWWACCFLARLERYAFRPLTGSETLSVLADVELSLSAA